MDTIPILVVEDNLGDVRFIRSALRQWTVPNEVYVVGDGEEAISFLYQQEPYRAAPRPRLILLDLNLPVMDGCEVLAKIKSHSSLRRIPVLVLTTSAEQSDIISSYDHHANAFMTNPLNYKELINAIRHIETFWLSVATLSPA